MNGLAAGGGTEIEAAASPKYKADAGWRPGGAYSAIATPTVIPAQAGIQNPGGGTGYR